MGDNMGNYLPEDRIARIEDKLDRVLEKVSGAVTWRQVWAISGGLSVIVSSFIEILRAYRT